MTPHGDIADEEVSVAGPFQSVTWRVLLTNGLHLRSTRGRRTSFAHLHQPLSSAPLRTIKIPLQATPHERYYSVRVVLGTAELLASWLSTVTITTYDLVGAGHSTTTTAGGRVLGPTDPSGAADVPFAPDLPRLSYPRSTDDPQRWVRVASDWISHECNASLTRKRIMEVTLSAPAGAPSGATVVLLGVAIKGYDRPEVL